MPLCGWRLLLFHDDAVANSPAQDRDPLPYCSLSKSFKFPQITPPFHGMAQLGVASALLTSLQPTWQHETLQIRVFPFGEGRFSTPPQVSGITMALFPPPSRGTRNRWNTPVMLACQEGRLREGFHRTQEREEASVELPVISMYSLFFLPDLHV